MTGEVIKQFLVGLGFGVDEKSLKNFGKAIDASLTKVKLISAAIVGMASGAFFGIAKISEGFEEMGYATRMIAPAINKAILLRKAMVAAYKDAGINMIQAVQASIKFNMSLAKTKFQLEGIVKSTAIKFLPMLTKQMDIFRTKVSANMPKILALLERFIKFVFKAFEGVVILGTRLWSMFGRLWDVLASIDSATGGWSTKILALAAAWKVLNLSFLASPLGLILVGLLAILALYDDFMTFKEGGESLFDWGSPAVQTITGVVAAVVAMVAAFKVAQMAMAAYRLIMIGLTAVTSAWKVSLIAARIAMMLTPIGWISAAITGLIALIALLVYKWDSIKKSFGGFFSGLGGKVLDFVGGDVNKNLTVSPLGSNGGNSSSNNVKQETNIIVQGASDPATTATRVANQQDQINFNMTRNMKGAAR